MEGRLNRLTNAGLSVVLLAGALGACKGSALNPDRTPNPPQFRPCAAGATPQPEASPDLSMNFCLTDFGFSFQYPQRLSPRNLPEPNTLSFLEGGAQRLLITVDDSSLSLSDYAESHSIFPGDTPVTPEPLTIAGREALALVTTTNICDIRSDETIRRTRSLLIRDGQRIIEFIVNDSCDSFETDWFSQIPPTIRFSQ